MMQILGIAVFLGLLVGLRTMVSWAGTAGTALFCVVVVLGGWLTALSALKWKRLSAMAGSLLFCVVMSAMGLVNFASADGRVDGYGISRPNPRPNPGDPPQSYVYRGKGQRRMNAIKGLFENLFSVHLLATLCTAAIAASPSILWYRKNKKEYVDMTQSRALFFLGVICFGVWILS